MNIRHQHGSISLYHAYVIVTQCCAPMTQCYQASIYSSMLCIRHQYSCASIMAQFGSLICIMHQNYGSVPYTMAELCIHGSLHDVLRHQYGSMLCIRHQCGCALCINNAWLDAVHKRLNDVHQASVYMVSQGSIYWGGGGEASSPNSLASPQKVLPTLY